tara:strand:- start:32 stop:277 length:246 start_codon:yes stop_codon:yes gene_type:complete
MNSLKYEIEWPNNLTSFSKAGEGWIEAAKKAGISIPTGCLCGSCGACEIEVNGEVIRACISEIPTDLPTKIKVDFAYDPFW